MALNKFEQSGNTDPYPAPLARRAEQVEAPPPFPPLLVQSIGRSD